MAFHEQQQLILKTLMPGHSLHPAALLARLSTPGVGTALVGMERIANGEQAMAVASQSAEISE